MYNGFRNSFVAHRITGSSHWDIKYGMISFLNTGFVPHARQGFTDTGYTYTSMPYQDWDTMYDTVCFAISQQYADQFECQIDPVFGQRQIVGPGIASFKFPPIKV